MDILLAVTEKLEIKKANDLFFNKLNLLSYKSITVNYTTAGNSSPINISYSESMSFWWANSIDIKRNRYWNPFGLGKEPKPNANVVGPCQFNCLYEGADNSVAGLFAKDSNDSYYLLHSGRFGGGQKGVGKNRFLDWSTYDPIMVLNGVKESQYYVVTKFSDRNFYNNILSYVQEAKNFKDYVKESLSIKVARDRNPLKDGEYIGIKTYDLPARNVIASNEHAVVTNSLIEKLRILNYNTDRDQFRDAYTVNSNNKVDRIFEVKTSFTRQKLYTAVGQLIINGLSHNSQRFFVLKQDTYNELVNELIKIPIKTITYKIVEGGTVKFYGLNKL